MSSFERAFDFAMTWETGGDPEGGYTCDPDDPGGATRWGISKRANPDVDPETITKAEAEAIYRRKYWAPTGERLRHFDEDVLELVLFDFAVHSGPARAVEELQRLVGAEPDGAIGPATRDAISRHAFNLLARELVRRRERYLEHLCLMSAKLEKYKRGWLRRCKALEAEIEWGEKP